MPNSADVHEVGISLWQCDNTACRSLTTPVALTRISRKRTTVSYGPVGHSSVSLRRCTRHRRMRRKKEKAEAVLVKLLYKMKDEADRPHEYTYTYRWQMRSYTHTQTVRLSERRPTRARADGW
jgi:hypothetical protein